MAATTDPASEHIRVMEARLRAQTALVVRLRQIRQDASEAMRHLELLQRALEEMRLQLAQLGSGLIHSQKMKAVAKAIADRKV